MTYTLTQVLDTMQAVVDEFGTDYVQEVCTYREDEFKWVDGYVGYKITKKGTTPVCIVAQVIYRLDPDLLAQVENNDTWQAQEITEMFEPDANIALSRAQEAQDGRSGFLRHEPWGVALDEARKVTA